MSRPGMRSWSPNRPSSEDSVPDRAPRRASPYERQIREVATRLGWPRANPRHVEAYMRLEHSTLDALSPERFADAVVAAAQLAGRATHAENEALAESFGLGGSR